MRRGTLIQRGWLPSNTSQVYESVVLSVFEPFPQRLLAALQAVTQGAAQVLLSCELAAELTGQLYPLVRASHAQDAPKANNAHFCMLSRGFSTNGTQCK